VTGAVATPGERGVPRWLLVVGIPVAGLLLVAFFVYTGFPYERLREGLARQVEAATGADVTIGSLGPGLTLLGPGLRAGQVVATPRGGDPVRIDSALVRPAWSFAWLGGDPALAVDVAGELGGVDGTVVLGAPLRFAGGLEAVALERLPLGRAGPGRSVPGRAGGDVDLTLAPGGPEGEIDLEARSGTIALPSLPMALPFESLDTDVTLGGEQRAEVRTFSLEGPMLAVRGDGTVGASGRPEAAPLDLRVQLEVREPGLRQTGERLGVALDAQGHGEVRIGGTVGQPVVR